MDAVVDRIFSLTKEIGMEQKKLAEILGITDKKVSAWKTGRSKTYRDQIEIIAEVLGTTTEYLLTGEGSKARIVPDGNAQPDLVLKYNQLSPEGQKEVLAFIEFKQAQESAIAARGGTVVKKPSPVSAETLDKLSQATEEAAKKENDQY